MAFEVFGRELGYPKCKHSVVDGDRAALSYTDRYKILVDEDIELGETLLAQLPSDFKLGETLGGVGARLKDRDAERDKNNRRLWYLNLFYTTDFPDIDLNDLETSPDLRPAQISWDFETMSYVPRTDIRTGAPIVTSSEEPIELTTEMAIPILTIERFEYLFDAALIVNFVNRANLNWFWGADAGMVVCTGIRDRFGEVWEGYSFRRVTYTFKFLVPFVTGVLEGVRNVVINQGNRYKASASDTTWIEARTKVMLNRDGTKRAAGQSPDLLRFYTTGPADFDQLGVNVTQLF